MAAVDMTMTMSINLLIDAKANKVVYAEASKEFVDFLFFLLALPMATVTRLVTSESMVGSIASLYTSFANLNESYLQQDIKKDQLLNPVIFSSVATTLPFSINQSSTFGKTGVDGFIDSKGYVKEMVPYMVSDDLSVMPISTMSIQSMMNKFNVFKLDERKVNIGAKEALEILKTSLQSTTVLTDVFLGKKEITLKAVKIEESSTQFPKELEEKLNQPVLTREHMSNEELQDARKELINVFKTHSVQSSDVGLKRMGDIEQSEYMSYQLVYKWQNNIDDPNWQPFKMIFSEGKQQQVVDKEDSKLKELRRDWGGHVYNAVVKALMERNEYSQTEETPVHELWHIKEGRKATLKEGIQCLSDDLRFLNDLLRNPPSERGQANLLPNHVSYKRGRTN